MESMVPSRASRRCTASKWAHMSSAFMPARTTGTATTSPCRTTTRVLPAQGPAMLIDALVAYPLSAEVRSPVRVSSTHTATTAIIGERGPMPYACAAADSGPRVGAMPARSWSSRSRRSRSASATTCCWYSTYACAAWVLA